MPAVMRVMHVIAAAAGGGGGVSAVAAVAAVAADVHLDGGGLGAAGRAAATSCFGVELAGLR